jgi:hypothetical protein
LPDGHHSEYGGGLVEGDRGSRRESPLKCPTPHSLSHPGAEKRIHGAAPQADIDVPAKPIGSFQPSP